MALSHERMTEVVFTDPFFTDKAVVCRAGISNRNQFGEWIGGSYGEETVDVIPEPVHLRRDMVEDGARLDGAMRFYMRPSVKVDVTVQQEITEVEGKGRAASIIMYPVGRESVRYIAHEKWEWRNYTEVLALRSEDQIGND